MKLSNNKILITGGATGIGLGFVEAVFQQMKEGKTELTFGFSEALSKANPEGLQATFGRLNPS